MVIRPVRDDDFTLLAAITNQYIMTSAIHFGYDPVAAYDLAEPWQRHGNRYPWLVVEDGGIVAGYAKAGTWRDRAAYAWTTELGLYLDLDARGRGLGTALYRELVAEVERRGFRSAIGGVTLPNDASVALHRRLGFESVGIVRDAGLKLGSWHDVEFFQKRFATGGA